MPEVRGEVSPAARFRKLVGRISPKLEPTIWDKKDPDKKPFPFETVVRKRGNPALNHKNHKTPPFSPDPKPPTSPKKP